MCYEKTKINNNDYTEIKVLRINEIIKLENLKFAYKYYNNYLPVEIMKNVLLDHEGKNLEIKHKYNTRGRNNIRTPLAKTNMYLNSILCKSIQEFRMLKGETRTLLTIHSFVHACKHILTK